MRKYVLLILFGLCSFAYAQEVKVEVDTTSIRIGEQFNFQISVNDTANVIIPKLENLQGLEIVEDIPTDTVKKSLIKKYLLTSFDSGAYYIPSQQVFIRNRAFITDSILINVATVAIDTTQQKMFPIKAIQSEPFTFDDFKPYIKWILLALFLIIGLIYYLKTRKKKEVVEKQLVPTIPAFEEALAKLKELDEKLLWQNNKIKQYYTELTDILQNYLGRDVEIPTLELTSSEIIDLVETQNNSRKLGIEKDTFKLLELLLKNADLVKFAKSKPLSHEIEDDRRLAEKIISTIQPKIKEYKEATALEQGKNIEVIEPIEKTVEKKKVKPSWFRKNRTLVIIVSVLLLLLTTAAIAISALLDKFLPPSAAELSKKEWVTKTYGNIPSLTMTSPMALEKQAPIEVPEEVKRLVLSSENYSYSNRRANLEIAVATSSYVPSVQTSLDGAVSGAQNALSQEAGVTIVRSDIEDFNIFSIDGKKVTGKLNQRGVILSYTSLFLVDENKLWTLMFTFKEGDTNCKAMVDRMINSIKIDSANVE
jgi:hypothetical protein